MELLFSLVVVCGCITTITTYECYSCNNLDTDACGEPFYPEGKGIDKNEVPERGACTLTRYESKGGVTLSRGTTRDVAADCIGGVHGCLSYTENGVTTRKCCCQTEVCNSVSSLRTQLLNTLFVSTGVLAMSMYRWF